MLVTHQCADVGIGDAQQLTRFEFDKATGYETPLTLTALEQSAEETGKRKLLGKRDEVHLGRPLLAESLVGRHDHRRVVKIPILFGTHAHVFHAGENRDPELLRQLFDPSVQVMFRPSFFPYTEPSAEVFMTCVFCQGDGCAVCKKTGWLEILGSGMVHPAVFEAVGYDPERYTGWAFGVGIDRVALLKYRVEDIRLFYENDLRLLEQFPY